MGRSSKHPARRRKLTELVVRRTRPEPAAFLIWDTLQRGLALRVHPTGRRSWLCIYRSNRRPRWLHLGDAGAIALGDARVLAAEVALEVARGRDPAADKRAKRSENTFADLARRYVEEHAQRHNKSWRQADALIRRNVLPRWSKLPTASITRADVKTLIGHIAAPIVANQTLAAVSAAFSWAVKEELLSANPARGVDRHATKARERVLSESEVPLLWVALDEIAPTTAAALRMVLLLGQRPGEVTHMRIEHLRDGWWEMPGEPIPKIWPGTKNGKSHRVWIPAAARAIVADIVAGDDATGFVFPGQHHQLDRPMRDISAKLDIVPVTPHDFRRTHGSTITALGFGRDAMNRIQNHAEGGIASVYDRHQYADENRRIMEAVASKIMALVEGRGDDSKIVRMSRS